MLMKAAKLAEELAEFWFSAIAGADWEGRLKILQEIDAQLLADLEKRSDYEAVWSVFVAAVIERLGAPPVTNAAQAKVYALSSNERHRGVADAWVARGVSGGQPITRVEDGDRRRYPRQRVNAISEIWVSGRAASCRIIDLSQGGARVVAEDVEPVKGTAVRLAVPSSGVRDATVVFRNRLGIGLEFSDSPQAA